MFPFSAPFAMWSPLRVELVEQRLEEVVSSPWQMFRHKPLMGRVEDRRVVVYVTPQGRRSGPARKLDVRLIPEDGGTRLEGRFRLRWVGVTADGIFVVVMTVIGVNELIGALNSDSMRDRRSVFIWVLFVIIPAGTFFMSIFDRADDRRLIAGLEQLLASERPKELDGA